MCNRVFPVMLKTYARRLTKTFVLCLSGYQLVSNLDGAMSSTTVPPTIVLQPGQESVHPDNMAQLRPYFRTAPIPPVRAVTPAISTAEPQLPIRAFTPKATMTHTDPLRIVQTRNRETNTINTDQIKNVQTPKKVSNNMNPAEKMQANKQQINLRNIDPSKTVQANSKETNTIKRNPATDLMIQKRQQTNTESHTTTSATTITKTPIGNREPDKITTDKDSFVVRATPELAARSATPERRTSTSDSKPRQAGRSVESTTVASILVTKSSSPKQTTMARVSGSSPETARTSPISKQHDMSTHPVHSHVVTVLGLANNSRDFINLRTKKTHTGHVADGSNARDLMVTRYAVQTPRTIHTHSITTVSVDIFNSTEVVTAVYNLTTIVTDVYNTTAVSTSGNWKTKWGKACCQILKEQIL